MSRGGGPGEWLLRIAFLAHPRRFRDEYAAEMLAYYRAVRAEHAGARGRRAAASLTARAVWSALRVGAQQRFTADRQSGERTGTRWLEALVHDLRLSARSIRREPGFATVVIVTLALGLGANTAVFSILHSTLLEPLPYPGSDRLVRLYSGFDGQIGYLPGPSVVDFRENLKSVDALAAVYTYSETGADLTGGDRPERLRLLPVSADYFGVLGTPPMLGRGFERAEERADAVEAVVSHALWQRAFGGSAAALGQSIMLNGEAHRVIGVMPAGFEDPLVDGVDVWVPQDLEEGRWNSWGNHYLSAIARLRPGVSLEQAQAEVDLVAARQRAIAGADDDELTARLVPLHEDLAGGSRTLLFVLTGAVGLLLAIACVNIANLLLARGASRQSELAVRTALGSGRGRLAGQLLTESLVLALLGGAAGLVLSVFVTRGLYAIAPAALGRADASTDATVFGFAFLLSLAAGVAAGVAPVLQFSRPALASVLRESGRTGDGGRRQVRVRNALVVAEVALALVLVVGAGILLRSYERLGNQDLGVHPESVWTFQVNLPEAVYDAAARARFHVLLHDRIAAQAGVRAVGAISRLPVTGNYHSWGTRRVDDGSGDPPSGAVNQRVVEGDYFAAAGIALRRGRLFSAEDRADAPRRVVVNEALVRAAYRPDENPVGDRLIVAGDTVEIIGVVEDVPITARGQVVPMAFHSHAQFAADRNWALVQVVAFEGPVSGDVAALRRVLAGIDPNLVLHDPQRLEDVIGDGVAKERFALLLVGAFAALALTLAAVGLYGLLAYSVARQRREIGIRLALGARPSRVRRMVVAHGARLASAGLAIGLVAAFAATRALDALVFDVSVRDPLVFAVSAGALGAIALLASYIPALSATRVDPASAFRHD